VVLCVKNTAGAKTWFSEVLCIFSNTADAKSDSLLSGKFLSPRKWRSGEDLQRSLTTMLEQIALQKILLLEEIQGQSAPGQTPF
jgi:hypothetical protein